MRACLDAAGYKGDIRFEEPKKGDNISTWFNQNEFITSQKARERLGWSTRHDGIIETRQAGLPSPGKRRRTWTSWFDVG